MITKSCDLQRNRKKERSSQQQGGIVMQSLIAVPQVCQCCTWSQIRDAWQSKLPSDWNFNVAIVERKEA